MGKLFGTDGVRGIANKDLTGKLAYELGRIGTYVITKGKKNAKILVGMDTRISGDLLESALIAGICSVGADAYSVEIVPTPAVAYLTRAYDADAGIVISASHNPVEYNGIKFFNSDGYKLNDEIEDEIESYILANRDVDIYPTGKDVGKKTIIKNATKEYLEHLKKSIDCDFSGIKIAVDCGNGANYLAAPELLKELGAEVEVIHNAPNGLNINVNCGSTNPEMVQQLVLETGADIGVAFDGDADRLIAVDETGNIVDGDHILAICGLLLKEQGKLNDNRIVGTVMSNMGLDICLEKNGMSIVKTQVGDRYVLEEMVKHGYMLGGEQSGHIIFLEHNTTGDGLLTALQLILAIKKKKMSLSQLASIMEVYPQILVNAKVDNFKKYKYKDDDAIQEHIKNLENQFDGKGRVLIRPSGTEPLVRVMIEGESYDEIKLAAEELANEIEKRFN